jgi:hypothetical protein
VTLLLLLLLLFVVIERWDVGEGARRDARANGCAAKSMVLSGSNGHGAGAVIGRSRLSPRPPLSAVTAVPLDHEGAASRLPPDDR